jgi:hypothetical protein
MLTKELTDEQIRSVVDMLPSIPPRPKIDLLLVFYVYTGGMGPSDAFQYMHHFRKALHKGHWEFPEGVQTFFVPTKGEPRVQAIPIKGLLDGTIRESVADIEKMLFELQENVKLAKLLDNKE